MSETQWLVETLSHWLVSWTLVVGAIVLLLHFTRQPSIRYAGWLVTTFAGVVLLFAFFLFSPAISWQQALAKVGAENMADSDLLQEMVVWFDAGSRPGVLSQQGVGTESLVDDQASSSVARTIVAVWLMGMALFLLRLLIAAVHVRQLFAQANLPLPDGLSKQFIAICREVGMRRKVELAVHPKITGPMCTGLLRPTVIWPAASRDQLNMKQRAAALVHELDHLRRYDDWVRFAGELWRALCWFYLPLHWTLSRLRREQEFLCDNRAAIELDSSHSYAQLLLDQVPVRTVASAICSSFAGESTMAERVRRILRGELSSASVSRSQAVVLIGVTSLVLLGASSVRLVGFGNQASATSPQPADVVVESLQENVEESTGQQAVVEFLETRGAKVSLNDGGKVVAVDATNKMEFTDEDLEQAQRLDSLESLAIGGTAVTNDGLTYVSRLTNLTRLRINDTQITEDGLAHLVRMEKLSSVIAGNTKIGDAGLESLARLVNLRGLGLWNAGITNSGLKHLSTNVEVLYLQNNDLSDAGIRHLKNLQQLRQLNVSGSSVTNEGLAALAGLTNLSQLAVWGTKITDDGLVHLKKMKNLQWLYLNDTVIGDTGLRHIRHLTSLTYLNLKNTNVTNIGLEHVKDMSALNRLELGGTNIGDAGLLHLAPLTELKTLNLEGTKVTRDGVEKLKASLPECKIEHP